MNHLHIRTGARWAAGIALALGAAGITYGLVSDGAVSTGVLLDGVACVILVVGFWLSYEVMISCTEKAIASQPKARAIVTQTLQAMEDEAVQEAQLPRIGGERLR